MLIYMRDNISAPESTVNFGVENDRVKSKFDCSCSCMAITIL